LVLFYKKYQERKNIWLDHCQMFSDLEPKVLGHKGFGVFYWNDYFTEIIALSDCEL